MAKKISNQLVLLSSAAIVSIYGVGFLHTEAAADKPAAADTVATSSTTTTSSSSSAAASTSAATSAALPPGLAPRQRPVGGFGDQGERRRNRDGRPPFAGGSPDGGLGGDGEPARSSSASATSTASAAAGSTASSGTVAASPYRDGSYSGSAENRHGDLTVTVVVTGGRIASADIADCGMQYPCSRIADLPGEAVQRQSAEIDQVTGATYSWMAYHDALTQALAQAQGKA